MTGSTTVNITALPEGTSTLWIKQDGVGGHTVTIGTGWGTSFDATGSLGTTANASYRVQFEKSGTDIIYGILTSGN